MPRAAHHSPDQDAIREIVGANVVALRLEPGHVASADDYDREEERLTGFLETNRKARSRGVSYA